ncbi:MAG: hypothetical protein LBJ84_00420, partial [Oscillospiraceae bacterium]|nr:hypothetical protein [Oscillospiraceae bacterium]
MSRGKKLSLFLVFFIYLAAIAAALVRPGLGAALDAFGRWRSGDAGFPTGAALAAAGAAAAIFVLAYIFYYIAAESRKYFSMALRAAMWLCVFAALAPVLSSRYLEPFLESHEYGLPPYAVRRISDSAPAFAVAVAAFIMICGIRGAVKRAAAAAGALAEGKSDVHMRQMSGDELQDLAIAVNSFAREYSKRTQGVLRRDESYMKFIPQQLVSLMGVDDIEQVNRNTALVRV